MLKVGEDSRSNKKKFNLQYTRVITPNVLRVAGHISATQRLGNTAPKNATAVASRWRQLVRFVLPGI